MPYFRENISSTSWPDIENETKKRFVPGVNVTY